MRNGLVKVCCVVFAFAFTGVAYAEICQGSHPEKCIEDNWHAWEEHHEHIKECVDRMKVAGDARYAGVPDKN